MATLTVWRTRLDKVVAAAQKAGITGELIHSNLSNEAEVKNPSATEAYRRHCFCYESKAT